MSDLKQMAEEYAGGLAKTVGATVIETSALKTGYIAGACAALKLAIKMQPLTLADSMLFEQRIRNLIPKD